jgi:peptidoglycan/LPS O-acetylase OafA/YrhL
MPQAAYRRDIDGLRAVAIVPVVLFHAGFAALPGGFVGVDVFFVISGYLIATVIVRDILAGNFSIAQFYERRFRRILPALAVMTLASVIVAHLVLLPEQLLHFGFSLTATALFVSNIFFWSGSGYFAPSADWMPLLHTWSLAVEEQYYIVFPVVMAVGWRWIGWRFNLVLALVMALSFGVGVYGSHQTPTAAFYLLPYRAWELLLGAVLALAGRVDGLDRRYLREVCASAGVLLIAIALVVIDAETVFPGTAALLPSVGAALILVAGAHGRSTVGDLLSTKPMVAVGLISYSLYLWHWPIFVFMRLVLATNTLPAAHACAGIGVALVAAMASWRYVERPFRTQGRTTRAQIFTFAGCASGAAIGLGALIQQMDGAPWRLDRVALAYARAETDVTPLRATCATATFDAGCLFGGRSMHAPTFAIWGDSHSQAMQPAIEVGMGPDARGVLHFAEACAPLAGAQRHNVHVRQGECKDYNTKVLAHLTAPASTIKTVFLVARWSLWSEGTLPSQSATAFTAISDDETVERGRMENRRVFARALQRTVARLRAAGKSVIIVGPTPEYGVAVPQLLALSARWNLAAPGGLAAETYRRRNAFVVSTLTAVAAANAARMIDLGPLFCAKPECVMVHDGKSLYSDEDHVTMQGAKTFVGPYLADALAGHTTARAP